MPTDREMVDAFQSRANVLGLGYPLSSVVLVTAQAKAETSYSAWGIKPNPHNYGAIKSPPWKPPCTGESFQYHDTGEECFRRYPNRESGIDAMLKLVDKMAGDILRMGESIRDYAYRLKKKGYYGISASEYERALNYRVAEIENNTGIDTGLVIREDTQQARSGAPWWVAALSVFSLALAVGVTVRRKRRRYELLG